MQTQQTIQNIDPAIFLTAAQIFLDRPNCWDQDTNDNLLLISLFKGIEPSTSEARLPDYLFESDGTEPETVSHTATATPTVAVRVTPPKLARKQAKNQHPLRRPEMEEDLLPPFSLRVAKVPPVRTVTSD